MQTQHTKDLDPLASRDAAYQGVLHRLDALQAILSRERRPLLDLSDWLVLAAAPVLSALLVTGLVQWVR
jgi:hypothetical protein